MADVQHVKLQFRKASFAHVQSIHTLLHPKDLVRIYSVRTKLAWLQVDLGVEVRKTWNNAALHC